MMVQWLAHPTSIQGDMGSIPTHGTCFFIHKKEQLVVRCRYFFIHLYVYVYIYTYIHIIIYKSEVGFLFIYVFQKRQLLFSGHSFGFL